jgi:CDP-diacylglycerol--glycerol-3-phosphate 3-phosphatidyltransferase
MTAVERPATNKLRTELTNLPNVVTMGRVMLIPFVLLLIDNYNPLRTFLASLLYIGAAAGDALDGYLARKRNQVSVLGKFLDPLADKLIVTAVLVYMVEMGRAPASLVVVLIGRDLAINGLRSIASAEGLVIAASDGGKIKTALQLVGIMTMLIHFRYPLVGSGALFAQPISVDYHRVGLILLMLSAVVSVLSGFDYMRKFFSAAWRPNTTP